MKNTKKYVENIKKSKKELSKFLMNLSYEEKIARVVEMQKMSAKLSLNKSKKIYIWNLD